MWNSMKVSLDDGAIMPERAHKSDAGLDLFTPIDFVVPAGGYAFVDTGVHLEIPFETRGHICSKSGLNRKHGLFTDGTIDEGYDGPVGIIIHNGGSEDYQFRRGDKVAQVVIERIFRPSLEVVDKVSGGKRGSDGFGSTGR